MKIQIGDKAPHFATVDQNGVSVSLSDFSGSKLILFFYPKDNTPGCTAEACSLRDGYGKLVEMGYRLLGVSPDSAKSHQNFVSKYQLPFSLLLDMDKTIMNAYGVWGEKKMYGKTYEGVLRTTFIIDENGIVEHVIEKVDTKDHTAQIIACTKR